MVEFQGLNRVAGGHAKETGINEKCWSFQAASDQNIFVDL